MTKAKHSRSEDCIEEAERVSAEERRLLADLSPLANFGGHTSHVRKTGVSDEANAAKANRRGAITAEAPYAESCSSGPSGSDWCPAAA
jgi:hypothetical protein